MYRLNLILLSILLIISSICMAQNIQVITYNIRLNIAEDGVNAWPNRSKQVGPLLNFHKPARVALQESWIEKLEPLQTQ